MFILFFKIFNLHSFTHLHFLCFGFSQYKIGWQNNTPTQHTKQKKNSNNICNALLIVRIVPSYTFDFANRKIFI